ncbi:Male sterility protein [Popillia japonica]|uniref:Fatty acyl-CoA reductase n=1 Tax=Popillia japonica TaxID=7064 RepID=A0AAW1LUZ8_POPJA
MDETESLPDRIFENYLNATILLTGGTGFLGKVILERLLRVFDVKRIYLLIRTKRSRMPADRLRDIFSNPLYDQVRKLKGDEIFEKCVPIYGEVGRDCLGLWPKDREILQDEVEYVINTAASIKFDDPLKTALLINAKGTLTMIELAKGMKKLKLFVHVSTAYSHPDQKIVEEKVYPIKYNYEQIISLTEYFDEDTIEVMRNR